MGKGRTRRGSGSEGVLADWRRKKGFTQKKGFWQIAAERRGSRRLPQIRAQMNADFLIREWLEVSYVLIPQIKGGIWG